MVTGRGASSIARWDMGEQKKAVVVGCGLTKPRVVKCLEEVMDQEGLVRYSTVTNIRSSLLKDSSLAS